MASATTIRYIHPPLFSSKLLPNHHNRHLHLPIRALGRSDFDSFVQRVTSGEALKDAWRSANDGIELLVYEAKRAADRVERKYSVSQRFDSLSRAASAKAREIDQEFGIARRWRTFSSDFLRNWPRYKKELTGIFQSPLGRGLATIFFLWFTLSGWLFRIFILATWILPFAAPLLIGTIANNFAIESFWVHGLSSIAFRVNAQRVRENLWAIKIKLLDALGAETLYGSPGLMILLKDMAAHQITHLVLTLLILRLKKNEFIELIWWGVAEMEGLATNPCI